MIADATPVRRGERRARLALAAGLLALALAGLGGAVTHVSIAGHWRGLFLLRSKTGHGVELKDDLVLGDGSRMIASVSFSEARRLLAGTAAVSGGPWLELEWDERDGSGFVRNHLADGTEIVTMFARYEESDGGEPHGLFVGGALPDIAADPALQNESGMSFHDARGWTHIWCNVNEAVSDPDRGLLYPSQFRFIGSRVLIRDRHRVVIESSHEIPLGRGPVRMDRYAYFTAGESFFKLGIRFLNLGEQDVAYSYAYGDEPWVGTFGSAEGNVGWVEGGLVETEASVDARENRWAGILDKKTGVANFAAWVGEDLPDLVYFSNRPGTFSPAAARVPLTSDEVFIGLQWEQRLLHPGESRSILLSLGIAENDVARQRPRLPAGAGPPPRR